MSKTTAARRPLSIPARIVMLVAVLAVVAAGVLCVPLLRAAGWALVVEEPVRPSDIIVVASDSGGAGALEAADLVLGGIAARVAVFMDPPSGEDHEFIRRGLPYEDASARQIRQLRSLGVSDIVEIPRASDGTESLGQTLPTWCDEHKLGSIVLVTTTDHSRRMRRVIDRAMRGHATRVTIRTARHSNFDPDQWWETRTGLRTGIIELQKLVLDYIRHPLQF
jgi:hypothetical protein